MRRYIEPLLRRWAEFRGKQAILVMLVLGLIFLAISLTVEMNQTDKIDLAATNALQKIQHPVVYPIMLGFTALGDTLTLILIAAAVSGYLFFRKRPLAASLAIVTLFGLPLNMLLKEMVGRPRPGSDSVSVLAPTIGLSYPSGHAMASAMLYGYLAMLCWMHIQARSTRITCAIIFLITAVMVSVSRVYLGAHWLSDVVGGWTGGTFCLLLLAEIYKHWGKRELEMHKPTLVEFDLITFAPDAKGNTS